MFGWLKKLYNAITGLWKLLPESLKEKIIDTIIESFEHILREYYKNKTGDINV